MKRPLLVLFVILFVIVLILTGCGSDKWNEQYKDAPRAATNETPADTLTFPDGFSNAATKCDHGHRVYVLYHGDAAYGSIHVVPNDPSCGGGAK